MDYSYLPIHLAKFWFSEGLAFFIRTFRNTILFLEEDLAVGLMWKLLFVPLFHDSSIVGRCLSFTFRIFRIGIGIFAMAMVTILLGLLGVYWLSLPFFSIVSFIILPHQLFLQIANVVIILTGISLFLLHVFTHPHKRVWQVSEQDLWLSSWVKPEDTSADKLLGSFEVQNLLDFLETTPDKFQDLQTANPEQEAVEAYRLAKQDGSVYIGPEHFFVARIKQNPQMPQFLIKFDLKVEDFEEALRYLERRKNKWRNVWIWDDDFRIHHLRGINRGWLGAPTPSLDAVSEDLTRQAARSGYEDYIGREEIVTEVVNLLSQESHMNVVLVGPAGAGKSALLNLLAGKIIAGNAPPALATKKMVALDFTRLLSGMKTQGELADRIKNIFDEVEFVQNLIIVVEEIHNLGLGESGGEFNLYSLMLPYLESSTFQFIGTTEPENYAKTLEKNSAFARLFTKVELPSASMADTLKILEDKSIELERRKKIKVSFPAIKKTVDLSHRLLHDKVLPDSAISILNEAVTLAKDGWVSSKTVDDTFSRRVSVPIVEIGNVDKERLLDLEALIHQKMIDQEEAVKAVSDALRRSAVSLREQTRPIGVFLFVGPTGVGKTELAKTLSEVYFKNQGAFLRFDMSEYQNPESVARLIGASGQEGQLTEAVRNKPYALVLLDEFEKADPKILTLFLQVFDDGRLTDGEGRTIDFTNTIIIATSNAGSYTIAEDLKHGVLWNQIKSQVNEELLKIYKPELVNRFDEVVLFKPLSEENLKKIVLLKLNQLKGQLHDEGYLIEFDDRIISDLAQKGFDPVMGARPLRRLIQDTLEAQLSQLILQNKLNKGVPFKLSPDTGQPMPVDYDYGRNS